MALKTISRKTDNPPPGGSANICAILYQLLWSLLQTASIRVDSDVSSDGLLGTRALVVLEPAGGGGDLRVESLATRSIQQLKAGRHAWSLQNTVAEVLPDLYKAVNLDRPNDKYQFVTEGWMGGWAPQRVFSSRSPQESARNLTCSRR